MFILEWLQLRAKLNFEVLRSALLCVRVWRCGKGPKNQVEICPSQDNIESSDIKKRHVADFNLPLSEISYNLVPRGQCPLP